MRRFKLVKVETKEVQGKFGPKKRDFAHVEDQRRNKTGQVYIIPYRIQKDEKLENTRFDHTVSFRLNAIGKTSDTFDIEENGTFEIPQGVQKIQCKLVAVEVDNAALKQGKVIVTSVKVDYGAANPIEIIVN